MNAIIQNFYFKLFEFGIFQLWYYELNNQIDRIEMLNYTNTL